MNPKKSLCGKDPATYPGWEVYESATRMIRRSIDQGCTYDEACDIISNLDHDLKNFIKEDFLKIIIAEEHFGTGLDMDDLALYLGLSYEKVESTRDALISDIVRETTEISPVSSLLVH